MEKQKDPIGQLLRKTRTDRDVSVPELAELLGIPKDRIYKWEKGTTPKYEDRQVIDKWINDSDWKKVPMEPKATATDTTGTSFATPQMATLLEQLMQKQNHLMEMQNKILADTKQDLIEKVKEIHVNSRDTISYLQTILRMTRADDGVIMDNQDVQAGREVGSSATYAGNLEIAAAMEQKKDTKKKGSVHK